MRFGMADGEIGPYPASLYLHWCGGAKVEVYSWQRQGCLYLSMPKMRMTFTLKQPPQDARQQPPLTCAVVCIQGVDW